MVCNSTWCTTGYYTNNFYLYIEHESNSSPDTSKFPMYMEG